MAKTKTQKPKNKWVTRFILYFWLALISMVLAVSGVVYGTSKGMLGKLPDVKELENPEINVASEIISSDGVVIDRYELEKRIPITYQDIPTHMVQALYAREDERYDDHSGVDGKAVLRAVFSGGSDGGGSTITQQLAKQLFSDPPTNKFERIKQKLKEWVVAAQLEKRYTKEEILTMYLNKFDFIYRAHGIEAAAQTYYQKPAKDLTLNESAMLIAMLKNPVLYNPISHPEAAKKQRNVVLNQMLKLGYINRAEYDDLKEQPLNTNFKMLQSSVKESYSAYFKYALKEELNEYFEMYEKKYGIKYDLYRDGLKIYTSIDSRMQKMAENAMKKHLKGLQQRFFAEQKGRQTAPFYNINLAKAEGIFDAAMRRTEMYKNMKARGMSEDSIRMEFERPRDSVKFYTWDGAIYKENQSWMDSIKYHKHIIQSGLMSMDPRDGTIKAWVGGIDYDYFKYDMVKQGKRQVGSTFKPLVYATAINQMNYTPCHRISNMPFRSGTWKPKNASGKYSASLSLREGLAHSVNMISARLISESGPKAVIQLARDLGIESPIEENLTISLGTPSISLYEMVGAFSTFANKGVYIKPEIVMSIEDKNGKILKDFEPLTREVVNEDVAYTMIDLMKGVVERGTGKGIRRYGVSAEVAGKTGTTDEGSDSWFIGATPHLVTGVWVGNEDRAAHFRGWQSQGAKMALPIWGYYMQEVYKQGSELGVRQSDKFEKPEGIDDRWDCSSLQGFNDFGDVASIHDLQTKEEHEKSVNEMMSADNDTIDFGE